MMGWMEGLRGVGGGGRFQGAAAWLNCQALLFLRENHVQDEGRADSLRTVKGFIF